MKILSHTLQKRFVLPDEDYFSSGGFSIEDSEFGETQAQVDSIEIVDALDECDPNATSGPEACLVDNSVVEKSSLSALLLVFSLILVGVYLAFKRMNRNRSNTGVGEGEARPFVIRNENGEPMN